MNIPGQLFPAALDRCGIGTNLAPLSCVQLPGVLAAAGLPLPSPGSGDSGSTWGLSWAGLRAAVPCPQREDFPLLLVSFCNELQLTPLAAGVNGVC